MMGSNRPPKDTFSKEGQPREAHKEALIPGPVNAEEIEDFINDCLFCTKTKMCLGLALAKAGSKEFKTANFGIYEAVMRKCDFNLWLIKQEVLLPREDREKLEYIECIEAIKQLYMDNLSSATRDEYGRNNWLGQNVDMSMSHEFADIKDDRARAEMRKMDEQQRGFSLRSVPFVGRYMR